MDKFDANQRFNQFIAGLPVREQTIGVMADGTRVVAKVHSVFGEAS